MATWSLIGPTGSEVSLHNLGVSVRDGQGGGMPPLQHATHQHTDQAGEYYQRSLARPRHLTLRLVPRHRHADLPTTRQQLLAALNPDLVSSTQPAYLRCAGTDKTLQLAVVYQGGLEGGTPVGEALELHMVAHSPAWVAITPTTPMSLNVQTALTGVGYVLQRTTGGVWSAPGSLNGAVLDLTHDSTGTCYAGGAFTGPPDFVAAWDGSAWVRVGTSGGPAAIVNTLTAAVDGTLYVGGLDDHVNRYRSGVWDTLTLGPDGGTTEVNAMVMGNDGRLYIGGHFDSGAAVSGHIAVHDPSAPTPTWAALDSGVSGGSGVTWVYALVRAPGGTLYVGGNFTTPGNYIAAWNPATSTWETLGSGLDGPVMALALRPDGRLVAAGSFSGHVAEWNGVHWRTIGTLSGGAPATSVRCLAVQQDGLLYAGGEFTQADGLSLPDKMARWNGSAWYPLDVNLPGTSSIQALTVDTAGTLLVGYGGSGNGDAAGITHVTNNGTASAYPTVVITGPGRVYELTNWTSGDRLIFDLELLAYEQLTICMQPGERSVSSNVRGNAIGTLVPGSNLAQWRLLPGTNTIGLYVKDAAGGTPTATMSWYEQHWSIDGAGG